MLLHSQIESNKRKTWLIMTGFLILFALVGASVGVLLLDDLVVGIVLALIFGGLYMAIMMASGTRMVMAMNGATEVKSEDDYPFLWNTVESLSIAARVPMPKVYVIKEQSPNAFAAGMSPQKAAVAVTEGLLERLSREEVEAVLAHEMAHVQNYDVRLATVAISMVAVIALLSDIVGRTMWLTGGRRRSNDKQQSNPIMIIIALVVVVLGPLIAVLIQLAISRNREYLADASGAELCRNPNALASALEKISGVDEPMVSASPSCAALYISNPTKDRNKRAKRSLFSTHPPAEERVRRLREMM